MSEADPTPMRPIKYEGECSRCNEPIVLRLTVDEAGTSQDVHVKCSDCGQVNWTSRDAK